ncbi:F0F1 ATP synthase subunit B' [Haematospirillum jordaniae]|uniref:ATP synthase subunit b n=1 Tax=Haematospirillum jordaniae TaxID=1549855 RepID=A0A143DCZ0_9PROT|nr:F0F1 ATP synthase subunit B' [Haematospirillum jordaniae]AMW34592.1 ATP synthase subunit B [Haematospirillum jordaniae]NKD58121.1 F0F1 ATP synthase subunit B' [Haematospirillum jordaniae]NKD60212.1 F0F1 ATP synthase subunit B' [Haematospirillum jordaniae]NKD68136.1 F0F1 ATP synthase subunit B' [Haematospirillum jordaniae]NKD80167.1 F0F1 ATP synthase subunit B' [Haematospirillum jordaniae]
MPQFEPSTFASQLFWLAVTFTLLYVLVSRYAIPRLGEIMEQRQRTVEDDLDRAKLLKAETETSIRAYEKALTDARSKAQDLLRQAQEEVTRQAEIRNREVSVRLAAQIRDGEDRIAKARDAALVSVRDLASVVASDAAAKLSGVAFDAERVRSAVADAVKEGD